MRCSTVHAEELVGQLLYSILGPLSYPVLLMLYRGKIGLKNRGFWIFSSPVAACS